MSFLQSKPLDVIGGVPGQWNETTDFTENFVATLNDDNLRMAANGLEVAIQDDYIANAASYFAATGEKLYENELFRSNYLNGARQEEGKDTEVDSNLTEQYAQFEQANQRLQAYREANPEDNSVKLFGELWSGVKSRSKDLRGVAARIGESAGITGKLGAFSAGLVASMNPRTNFLNFATLGIGGVGQTVTKRILTEIAAGGGIEAVNQFTGVSERQALMGVSTTTGEKLTQVGFAAAGAGLLRGAGELAPVAGRAIEQQVAPQRALGRAMLQKTNQVNLQQTRQKAYEDAVIKLDPNLFKPSDQAAIIAEQSNILFARANPYGDTDTGLNLHHEKLMDAMEPMLNKLKADLSGSTRMPNTTPIYTKPDFEAVQGDPAITEMNKNPAVIEYARNKNPDLINKYERLSTEIAEERRRLDDIRQELPGQEVAQTIGRAEDELAALETKARGASAKNKKKIQKEINAKREALVEQELRLTSAENAKERVTREALQAADNELRDIAPEISALLKQGRDALPRPEFAPPKISPSGRVAVEDIMQRQKIDAERPAQSLVSALDRHTINGMPLQDYAAKAAKELKDIEPKLDEMRNTQTAEHMSSIDSEKNTINLGRGIGDVDLDNTIIQITDAETGGTVTLREYLDQGKQDDELLKALSTCPTGI